jgi:hypothetical protein
MVSGRTSYSQALATFDPAAILASLSDEVTIWVAVHDEPLQGKDTASFLFGVLTQELAPFELTEEIVEGDKSAVLFETSLRGHRAQRSGGPWRSGCAMPVPARPSSAAAVTGAIANLSSR